MRTEPPRHLSNKSRELWRRLCAEFPLEDAHAQILLTTALEALDRKNQARAILQREGLVITDKKTGRCRANPAVSVERDSAKTMLAALHSLNLDLEPLARDVTGKPRPGRRPGDRGNHAYNTTPPNTLPQ